MGDEVRNKQIVLKDYINGFPEESDMLLKTSTIKLKVPDDCNDAVLLKNLYLSCDPYMRTRMRKMEGSYIDSFIPGSPITGYGVSRVVDSTHPNFKKGDLIWGITGWEEYALLNLLMVFLKFNILMCLYLIILESFACLELLLILVFMRFALPKRVKLSSFLLHLVLLANLQSCWGVMLLEVQEPRIRFVLAQIQNLLQ